MKGASRGRDNLNACHDLGWMPARESILVVATGKNGISSLD